MAARHQCSDEERHFILAMLEKGISQRMIAAQLTISRSSVRYWSNVWALEGRTSRKRITGASSKVLPEQMDLIDEMTRSNCKLPCRTLALEISKQFQQTPLSTTTIWRVRQAQKWRYKPPRKRQFLTALQKEKRLSFAHYHQKKKQIGFMSSSRTSRIFC